MQDIDFRMPGASHWGVFKNPNAWKMLCKNIINEPYIAEITDKPNYFMQRFIIQSIVLEGINFKEKLYRKKSLTDLLENKKLSLVILKYFLSQEIDIFKLNAVNNIMLNIIKSKPSILYDIHQEFNSYGLHRKLNEELIKKELTYSKIKI